MKSVVENPVLSQVFGLFQDYQKNGQFSRLFLETRGGSLTAHLSVDCSPLWSPWTERTRTAETTKPRRTTPSRRKRNFARREQWIAKKQSKTLNQDNPILEKPLDTEVVNKPVSSSESSVKPKDLKILSDDQSRKLVESVKGADVKKQKIGVIDQIDGQTDSPTVTFDLTISAVEVLDAFLSIEDNLCGGLENAIEKVPFISEEPSIEERDTNSDNNTLFTLEVQVINEETFLEKVRKIFDSWEPLYWGKPRRKLVKVLQRI